MLPDQAGHLLRIHVHTQQRTPCVQSQARSATKDMTDADTQAQFEDETGRLHNQFNFNDRAVQACSCTPLAIRSLPIKMLWACAKKSCVSAHSVRVRHPLYSAVQLSQYCWDRPSEPQTWILGLKLRQPCFLQTKVSRPQDASMMTEPPPSKDAGGSTSQWRIFDAYKAHQEKGSKAAEDQAKAKSAVVARRRIGELPSIEDPAKVQSPKKALEIREAALVHPDTPSVSSMLDQGDLRSWARLIREQRTLLGCFLETSAG